MKGNRFIAFALLSIMLSSCSTSVRFRTNVDNAELRINGRYFGETPTTVRMNNFLLRSYRVSLEAEGYEPYNGPVEKDLKVGALVVGLLAVWPLVLWSYGPRSSQYFVLRPVDGAPPASTTEADVVESSVASEETPPAVAPRDRAKELVSGKRSVAVLEFKIDQDSEVGSLTGRDLALLMETYLSVYDRFQLQDRLYLKEVLAEQELQATDLFDPAFARSLGSLRGPQNVLIGQVKKIGDGLTVFVKLVDVESGTQSRVFTRSDIYIGSRGINALKDALKDIAADIEDYYKSR